MPIEINIRKPKWLLVPIYRAPTHFAFLFFIVCIFYDFLHFPTYLLYFRVWFLSLSQIRSYLYGTYYSLYALFVSRGMPLQYSLNNRMKYLIVNRVGSVHVTLQVYLEIFHAEDFYSLCLIVFGSSLQRLMLILSI